MRKTIFIQREYLLDGYRFAIHLLRRYVKQPTFPRHEITDASYLISSHLSHIKGVYKELLMSKDKFFEVSYESKEVA